MDDNLKKVWQTLSEDYELPDYDTFKEDMKDEENLRSLWTNAKKNYDLPDYDQFKVDMGFGDEDDGDDIATNETLPANALEEQQRKQGVLPAEDVKQYGTESAAEKRNPQMFQQPEPRKPMTEEEAFAAEVQSLNPETPQGYAVNEQNQRVKTRLDEQGNVTYDKPESRGYYQAKESELSSRSRRPNQFGEVYFGWREGARVKQLDTKGSDLASRTGHKGDEVYRQVMDRAETMSDAQLIAQYNTLSRQITDASFEAGTAEGAELASALKAIQHELHARDLGYSHDRDVPYQGEADYRSAMQDEGVRNTAAKLEKMDNQTRLIVAGKAYARMLDGGDAEDENIMMAMAALYARDRKMDISAAYNAVIDETGVMQSQMQSDLDMIYQQESDKQKAMGDSAAAVGANPLPGADPLQDYAAATEAIIQRRSAGGGMRGMLNRMTSRALSESSAFKAYYNRMYAQHIKEGMSKVRAQQMAANDVRNVFRDREVQRTMPTTDATFVLGSTLKDNMLAQLWDAGVSLAADDAEASRVVDEAYQVYSDHYAGALANIQASAYPMAVDIASGMFAPANAAGEFVAKNVITRPLVVFAERAIGIGEKELMRRLASNLTYRTINGMTRTGVSLGVFGSTSALVRGARYGDVNGREIASSGWHMFKDGIWFGVGNTFMGKTVEGLTGAKALAGEAGVIAGETALFTALDVLNTPDFDWNNIDKTIGRSLGVTLAGRIGKPAEWAQGLAARVSGTMKGSPITEAQTLNKETRRELEGSYPTICRLMSNTSLAKDLAKGMTRGKYHYNESGEVDAVATANRLEREWNQMKEDKNVPYEVKRKVDYVLNGELSPRPAIANFRLSDEGEDGTSYGETLDINGNVITRHKFKNDKERKAFEKEVSLEAERNRLALEEQSINMSHLAIIQDRAAAVKATAMGVEKKVVDDILDKQANGEKLTKEEQEVVRDVVRLRDRAVEKNSATDQIKREVRERTGLDVDDIVKTPVLDRTPTQHKVLEEYEQRLRGEWDETQDMSDAEVVGHQKEQSQQEGREATDEDKHRMQVEYEQARAEVERIGLDPRDIDRRDDEQLAFLLNNSDLEPEDAAAVMAYVNAKARYDGMIGKVREDMAEAVRQNEAEVDERTNKTDGKITTVTLKMGDKQMHVVGGRVVGNEDGTINTRESSGYIIVRDPQTGEKKSVSPQDIRTVGESLDAQQVKNDSNTAIREKMATEQGHIIDGDIAFEAGQEYMLQDTEGKDFPIRIEQVDGETVYYTEGGDPTVYSRSRDELQGWIRAAEAKRQQQPQQPPQSGGPRDTTPTAPAEREQRPAAPVAEERPAPARMPMTEDNKPDWENSTPEQAREYLRDLDEEDTTAIIDSERKKASDAAEKALADGDVEGLKRARRMQRYWDEIDQLRRQAEQPAEPEPIVEPMDKSEMLSPEDAPRDIEAENDMQPVEEPMGEDAAASLNAGMSEEERETWVDTPEEVVDMLDSVAKSLGLTVRSESLPANVNGYQDGDVLVVNKDRGSNERVAFVMGHEMTHKLERESDEKGLATYDTFKDAALDMQRRIKEQAGEDYEEYIESLIQLYRDHHADEGYKKAKAAGMSDEQALAQAAIEEAKVDRAFVEREVAADMAGRMADKPELVRDLFNQIEEPTLMQRIKNWLVDFVNAIRGNEFVPVGDEEHWAYLADKYNQLYNEVVESRKRVETEFGERFEGEDGNVSGAKHSLSAIFEGNGFEFFEERKNDDGTIERVPREDEKGNVYVMLGGKKFDHEHHITIEDFEQVDSPLNAMMKHARKAGTIDRLRELHIRSNYTNMMNMFLDMGAGDKGGAINLGKNWQLLAETVFRSVAKNGDDQYSYSVDITKICKKNEAVINAISELQRRQGYGATPAQILDIYMTTHEEGYQAPCPVCYVFSRYIRNGKYASAAINGMEIYGEHLPGGGGEQWDAARWEQELNRITRKMADAVGEEQISEAEINKEIEKALSNANDAVTENLSNIDKLAMQLGIEQNKKNPDKERIQMLRSEIERLNDEYKAANQLVTQQSLSNWIKSFAIQQVDNEWVMREDAAYPTDLEDFNANALDLRLTGNTMVNYPAIQRLRRSGGAAAGKEVTQASNNDLGEIASGINASDEHEYRNKYKEAFATTDKKQRNKLLREANKKFKSSVEFEARQNLRGGQRMWSWSDNIERLSPDVVANLMQLEMLGSGLQSYSKQLEGVELVARMNGYVNGSLMGYGDGFQKVGNYKTEAVDGVERLAEDITEEVMDNYTKKMRTRVLASKGAMVHDVDGEKYVLVYDDIVGIDAHGKVERDENGNLVKTRMGLFDINGELDKAGNILVTLNDMHTRLALADDRVYFIIPWHKSGANNHVLASMYGVLGVKMDVDKVDYTNMQEEKNLMPYTKDGKLVVPEVNERLRSIWNRGREEAERKGWTCGLGELDSDGDKMTEDQMHYRRLRDLIFDGKVKDASKEDRDAIMNDIFLKQVYDAVQGVGGKMTGKDKKFIYPYEYWNTEGSLKDADENGWRYVEYCRRLGYRPKFSGDWKTAGGENKGNFVGDKGYWKLLIDRRMYKNNGEYQGMEQLDSSGYSNDLIDQQKTDAKYTVTRAANEEQTKVIVDKVQQLERERSGEVSVEYGMGPQEAARRYQAVRRGEKFSLSTEIAKKYPNWMDNQVVEDEGKNKARGQNTQIAGTVKTYRKVGDWIEKNLGKGVRVLDASSGLGLGTIELQQRGFNVEDIEPYPGKGRKQQPTYGGVDAYQRAMNDGKEYDFIISNAVLNVIPDDWRRGVLHDMAALLAPGGKMFINTRKKGEEKSIKNKIELESPQEVLVGTPDKITSYQRFFTPKELKDYVERELGSGYTVELATNANSGTGDLAAVVVTAPIDKGSFSLKRERETETERAVRERGYNVTEEDVGRTFNNYSGTQIGRATRAGKVSDNLPTKYGKEVGGKLYVHKDYAPDWMKQMESKAAESLPEDYTYNCVFYDPKRPDQFRFDEAPDFDTAREPRVGRSITVDLNTGEIVKDKDYKQIWHHKWQWVGDDYKGFDVKKSYEWSRLYAQELKANPFGNSLEGWNAQLDKFGLPHDELVHRDPSGGYSVTDKADIESLAPRMDGESEAAYTERIGEIEADEKAFVDGDGRFSLKREDTMRDNSVKYFEEYHVRGNKDRKYGPLRRNSITRQALDKANEMIAEMRDYIAPWYDRVAGGNRYLPEEVYGLSTIFDNASYGATLENTLICTRTLAYNDFCDSVKRKLGRPLTKRESFLASQMLYDIATDPQCLYCYVSLDRKAYDEYLLRYFDERDAVIERYNNMRDKSAENIDALYKTFLDGRKDTYQMRSRFNSWLQLADHDSAIGRDKVALSSDRKNALAQESNEEAAVRWREITKQYNRLRGEEKKQFKQSKEYLDALHNYLATEQGQIKDACAYAQGASWAKKEAEYRSYTGELLRTTKRMLGGLASHYGLRFYSFSEYSPAFILENMQMVRDAALRGLKGFAYTKEIDFCKIFLPTGININCSTYGRRNAAGEIVMDERQGANWDEARALRDQYENMGIVFVATDDEMVRWAKEQPWIDVIIPFHIVRTGADIAEFYGWTNYTNVSADYDAQGRHKDIMPPEHNNSIEDYDRLIAERGLTRRFPQFYDGPGDQNYMKLINETRRKASDTPILTPVFNMEEAKKSFDKFVEKGGYWGGFYEVGADDVVRAVDEVAADIEAGKSAGEVEYGRQDIDFDAAMSNLEKTRRRINRNREHGNTPKTSFSLKRDDRNAPTFYSNAAKAVDGIKQEKATGEQWKAMLTKAGGIKAGEDKWMGLSTWLDEHKGETLTKDEVAQFVAENGIEMREVNYEDKGVGKLLDFKKEFNDIADGLIEKFKKYKGMANEDFIEDDETIEDIYGQAFNEMVERYGDDFEMAFTLDDYTPDGSFELIPVTLPNGEYSDAAKYFLGFEDNEAYPINETRLKYTTKGLENKREIAFVVPGVDSYQESDDVHFGSDTGGKAIMWVRFGETTDTDGNRVLVIDEIQSNRHQDAREKGYRFGSEEKRRLRENSKEQFELERRYRELIKPFVESEKYKGHITEDGEDGDEMWNEFNEEIKGVPEIADVMRRQEELWQEEGRLTHENVGRIPAAPFEKNWHEVAMKRMLRLAAEEGFDKVAWTTGKQQNDRYNLATYISKIEKERRNASTLTVDLTVRDTNGLISFDVDKDGIITHTYQNKYSETVGKPLADVIGKEVADEVLHSNKRTFNMDEMEIGGEGMKGFYDQILPRFMDKYGKRWGVKTGEVTLNTPGRETMHSVDVTPEMRRSVMENGQPLFSLGAPYQGSKNKIAKSIVDLLPKGGRFVDLFSGGGAVTHAAMLSDKYDTFHMNDINPIGQRGFVSGMNGEWENYDREINTPEEFDQVRGTMEGIVHSHNYYGRNVARNGGAHARAGINRMKSLGELKPYADRLSTTETDYRDVELQPGDVVYADIPYQNTDKRGYGEPRFDKGEFVEWAQAQDVPVFVSEYTMPEGWTEIGSFTVRGARGGHREEKLWVQDKFADQYRDDIAEDGTMPTDARYSINGYEPQGGGRAARVQLRKLMETVAANPGKVEARRVALRELNGQAGALRKAMSKQKEYDRWTVDNLIGLAKEMLQSGLYKGMKPYEVQRLVNMVNQGVGRDDITRQANTVYDIMMKHQVREWENQFDRLLRIRENKIDANGVRVQGSLDTHGQRMVQTLKSALDLDEETLNERINDCRDRMGSDDDIVAGNAADEMEGLLIAQQHYDSIGRLKKAYDELKQARRTQLEQVYEFWREEKRDEDGNVMYRQDGYPQTVEKRRVRPEFGGVDENGNRRPVSEENKAKRKRVDATVALIEQGMRETQTDMVDAYKEVCDNLGGSVASSITRAKEWVERDKERVGEIHHAANSDLLNVDEKLSGMDRSKEKGLANNAVIRFLNSPLGSFEKFMRYFGQRSAYGEGRLFNKFMRGHSDCTDAEWRAYKEGLDTMNQKSEELFGCSWEKLMVRMRGGAFSNTKGKLGIEREFPPVEVSYWVDGKRVDDTLNQDEVAYLIACSKMTDGMMKLENMGIDENMIAQLRQQVDPKMLELADWYQHEFLPKQRNRINEVYKRMFGADMAHIDNYIHLNINERGLVENKDINQRMAVSETPSTITGSLKERRRNVKPIDLHTSLLDLAMEEHQKMENWIAWAEYNRDLKDLLNYKKFKNKVYNMKSVELGSGEQLWDKFSKAVAVVTGDFQGGGKHSEMDRFATNAAKFVSSGCINFRVHTALKQLLSFPAFMSDARPDDILKAAANPMGSVQWAMENLPGFSKRWESRRVGDTRLMDTDSDYSFWRNRWVQKVNKYGMTANASVDCLTVAVGARAVYETAKRRYMSYGYDEITAERKALQDAYTSYNSSQQSSEGAFTSPMQVERTFLSAIGTTFRNASMGYQRRVTTGARNIARMLKRGYKEDMIENTTKQMMEEGLSEEQARAAAERVYKRQLWHSMMDVANFAYALPFLWILGPTLSYLIAGDDKDIKGDTLKDLGRHAVFGSIEGLTFGGVMSELGNMVWNNRAQGNEWKDLWKELEYKDLTPLPLVSRMQGLFKSFKKDAWTGFNDLAGLLIQSNVGVDPNTLTDMGVAILDGCNGDLDTSKEFAFALLRIMQFPQSQIDNLYIDELGLKGKDLGKYSYEELARRYARYKTNRAVLPSVMMAEDARSAAEDKVVERFEEKVQERIASMNEEEKKRTFDSGDPDLKKMVGKQMAKDAGLDNEKFSKAPASNANERTTRAHTTYQRIRDYTDMAEDLLLESEQNKAKEAGDEKRKETISKAREKLNAIINGKDATKTKGEVKGFGQGQDEKVLKTLREERRKVLKELGLTR